MSKTDTKMTKTATRTKKAPKVAKAKCAISRKQFFDNAKPVVVEIDGQKQVANVKEFSTGSFGYHFIGKIMIEVDGIPVKVQANCILTAVGSKEVD